MPASDTILCQDSDEKFTICPYELFLLKYLGSNLKKVHSVKIDTKIKNIFADSLFFYEEILINELNQNLINKGLDLYKR